MKRSASAQTRAIALRRAGGLGAALLMSLALAGPSIACTPALSITKAVAEPYFDIAGDVLHYTIEAKNTGDVTLTGVTVADPKLGELDCVPAQPATLEPGESIVCTGTYTIDLADMDRGSLKNTATADSEQTAPVEASVTIEGRQHPGLSIDKSVEQSSFGAAGQDLDYSIVAKNTGNVTLTGVTVADDLLAELACEPAQPATLAPGESITCTGTYTTTSGDVEAGKVDNTATADSEQTGPVQDSAEVPYKLVPVPGLGIVKGVSLSADGPFGPKLTTTEGTTVHYQIVVSNTGNVTLTGVSLQDSLSDLEGCEIPSTLQPAASFTCAYSMTAKIGVVENVATADSEETAAVQDTATVTVPEATPSGSVEAETSTPRITPPPTDSAGGAGRPSDGSLNMVLLALAGLLTALFIVTPAVPARARTRR